MLLEVIQVKLRFNTIFSSCTGEPNKIKFSELTV